MAKEPQELQWIESLLPDEGYRRKAMFGGFAYYLDEKLILVMFESSDGNRTYHGKTYDFEIWNGCLFPVEKEHQDKALAKFPILVPHPILPKWLYLPLETEGFEELVSEILNQVLRPHSFWGSIPKSKQKTGGKKKAVAEEKYEKIDTRRPRMFSDETVEEKMLKAKKISDLKNLGPTFEAMIRKAGIKTPKQLFQLGWKKTMTKLVKVEPKTRHSLYAYALMAALANKDWSGLTEEEKREAREHMHSLAPAKKTPVKKKTPKKTRK